MPAFGRKIQSGFQVAGRKLKSDAQFVGRKVTTTARTAVQDAKEDHLGRKVNNSIQVGNRAIQTLTPLEKIPIIGTGVKILTGVSGASAGVSQFSQDQINRKRNQLERPAVMPRDEMQPEMFVG